MSFEGRIAVVTGAGSGIGAGISEGIAKRGGKVYVTDLRLDAATQVAEDLKAKGYLAEAMHLDVTDEKEIHTVVEEIIAAEGYIDFWINNSGISIITPFFKHTDEIWDKTLNINLTSQFKCCREVIPHMTPERGGSIINMSSQAGKAGTDAYQAYCASKSGVIGLTQSLAREFGPQGIRINALCPGIIVTPMWDQQIDDYAAKRNIRPDEVMERFRVRIPLRRLGSPEDVANVACFLLSDEASYLTGQALNVCGGDVMY